MSKEQIRLLNATFGDFMGQSLMVIAGDVVEAELEAEATATRTAAAGAKPATPRVR